MPRHPRSQRAFQGRGGRWIRPPKPRPKSQVPPPLMELSNCSDADLVAEQDGYESCDSNCDTVQLTEALMADAEPIAMQLFNTGHSDAASLILALCDRLQSREQAYSKLQARFQAAQVKQQQPAQNLQGQGRRWWREVQELRGRLRKADFHWFRLQQNCSCGAVWQPINSSPHRFRPPYRYLQRPIPP